MIKKILSAIIRPLYRFFLFHPFRYYGSFSAIRNIFAYSGAEEILKSSMNYVESNKLEGDYLEFGVYNGSSFAAAFHFAQSRNLNSMKFYAFDSFRGLPEIKGVDADGFCNFSKGEYACNADQFKKSIFKRGVDLNKVKIIPGWYDEVLNKKTKSKLPIKKASIICIDCDLYESTVSVLNFINDYLQNGTVLIFDDWFSFRGDSNRGEQKAFREWLKKNPSIKATEFHKFGWQGNSFIISVKRKDKKFGIACHGIGVS